MGSRLRVGRYRLVERLGGGQVAEIWRARGPLGREVVIKRLLPHFAQADASDHIADEARRLFARECRLQAGLRHPNLVRTLAVDAAGDAPLLVMEHVAGPTLQALLRWRWRDPERAAALVAHVVAEVCDALVYLHAGDDASERPPLVHRDVTPSNVLIGRDGAVKLIDLGIALPLGDPDYTRTQTGVIKGKPEFVAPERRAGAAGGPEADVFSVGRMLQLALSSGALAAAPELSRLARAAQAEQPAERPAASALATALRAFADERGFGSRELATELEARFAAEVSQSATRTLPGASAKHGARRAWLAGAAATVLAGVIGVALALHRRALPVTPNAKNAPAATAARANPATPAAADIVQVAPDRAKATATTATANTTPATAAATTSDVAAASPPAARNVASRPTTAPAGHRRLRHAPPDGAPARDDALLGKSLVDPFHP